GGSVVKRALLILAPPLLVAGAAFGLWRWTSGPPEIPSGEPIPDVIFVPTPQDVVEQMLELARVGKDDVVYDLGCGDGRIVVTAPAPASSPTASPCQASSRTNLSWPRPRPASSISSSCGPRRS